MSVYLSLLLNVTSVLISSPHLFNVILIFTQLRLFRKHLFLEFEEVMTSLKWVLWLKGHFTVIPVLTSIISTFSFVFAFNKFVPSVIRITSLVKTGGVVFFESTGVMSFTKIPPLSATPSSLTIAV